MVARLEQLKEIQKTGYRHVSKVRTFNYEPPVALNEFESERIRNKILFNKRVMTGELEDREPKLTVGTKIYVILPSKMNKL
jgi:hypothetical protein